MKDKVEKVVADTELEIDLGNWQLKADTLNFILRRKVGERYVVEGYYQDIEDVFNTLANKRLREADVKSMTALLKEVKALRKDIKQYAEEIKNGRSTRIRKNN